MAIEARRGGVTSPYWYGPPLDVDLRGMQGDRIILSFSMSSKGGGTTSVSVSIPPSDFKQLAKAMIEVDREAAIKSFGLALAGK